MILGDLMDRGNEAVKIQNFVLSLMEKDGVILIRGNHEDLFQTLVTEDAGLPYAYHVQNGTYDTALQLTGYSGFVFTNEIGEHLAYRTIIKSYKQAVTAIGRPDARFHDLRHSYAVAAIRSGDDIKTVQGNLGHATAAFTLDVYGHVTDQMKQASADRMNEYIKRVLSG